MPVVEVKLFPGRDAETKARLGAEITRVMHEVAGISPAATTVVFTDVPAENWVVAGKSLAPPKE